MVYESYESADSRPAVDNSSGDSSGIGLNPPIDRRAADVDRHAIQADQNAASIDGVELTDHLWDEIRLVLPPPKPRRRRFPGRKPLPDREALAGILYILKTGTPWEHLPAELGCGSGMTCWRRLRDWRREGVWSRIVDLLMRRLPDADSLDFSRAEGINGSPGATRARRNGDADGQTGVGLSTLDNTTSQSTEMEDRQSTEMEDRESRSLPTSSPESGRRVSHHPAA